MRFTPSQPLFLAATVTLLVSTLISDSTAATLRGVIQPNHILREFSLVGPDAKVVAYPLNGSQISRYEARIKRDGSWLLELPDPAAYQDAEDVGSNEAGMPAQQDKGAPPSDVYLLKYKLRGLQMDQYRVDVRPSKKPGQAPLIFARKHNPIYPIASALYLSDPSQLPLIDHALGTYSYFQSIQDFNALNYLWMTLKSPMILMALGAWAMVSLLPKLMATLDPEEAAQMKETQNVMMGRMTALQSGDWKGAMEATPADSAAGRKNGIGASGAQAGSGAKARKRN